jgi:broad specificity phosphatase PhoE
MKWIFLFLVSLVPTAVHAQASLIVLVRHGEKATTGGNDPSLSAAGEARAEALAGVLAVAGVQHILVTEWKRTGETAAVVAQQQVLTPVVVPVGRQKVPDHARAVARALDSLPAGSAALVVGHSNTIPPIIAALGGPVLPDLGDNEYATLFVLDRTGGNIRLIRSSYGAP